MNKQKIFFLISILGILILTWIANNQSPITEGKISSISESSSKTEIRLHNENRTIIIFDQVELEKNYDIQVYGKEEIYQNQTQIIAEKIILTRSS
jgi:hypothetical protein